MTPQTTIALIMFLAGFGSAWELQQWRFGAQEHERDQSQLAAVRDSAAASIRRADNVIAAQSLASVRLRALRADADVSRDALVSLSAAADQALRDAAASTSACISRASAFRDVFNGCTTVLQDMAATADRINSDLQTLIDAWPK